MKSWVKEVIWFAGTLIVAYFIFDPSLTFNFEEVTVDVNIHDTYFVVSKSQLLVLAAIVFFTVYLLRMIYYRFRNVTVNILFIISNLFLILSVLGIINIVCEFMDGSVTVYPPLSAVPTIQQSEKEFKGLYYMLLFIEALLIIFELFVLCKTIILYKKSKQDKQA